MEKKKSGSASDVDLEAAQELAVSLAKRCGALMLENFNGKVIQHIKEDGTLATDIDDACQKIIVDGIKKRFPEHRIIAEEGETGTDETAEYVWYVDPLDGTHNYIHRVQIFGTSIALSKNGQILLGVLFFPALEEMFTAIRGKGAFRNGKRITVSDTADPKLAMITLQMDMRASHPMKAEVLRVLRGKVLSGRDYGSAAFHLARVAMGSMEAFVAAHEPSWDYAAGALIVEEAGGKMTSLNGSPVNVTPLPQDVVISNGKLHEKIIKMLEDISERC